HCDQWVREQAPRVAIEHELAADDLVRDPDHWDEHPQRHAREGTVQTSGDENKQPRPRRLEHDEGDEAETRDLERPALPVAPHRRYAQAHEQRIAPGSLS